MRRQGFFNILAFLTIFLGSLTSAPLWAMHGGHGGYPGGGYPAPGYGAVPVVPGAGGVPAGTHIGPQINQAILTMSVIDIIKASDQVTPQLLLQYLTLKGGVGDEATAISDGSAIESNPSIAFYTRGQPYYSFTNVWLPFPAPAFYFDSAISHLPTSEHYFQLAKFQIGSPQFFDISTQRVFTTPSAQGVTYDLREAGSPFGKGVFRYVREFGNLARKDWAGPFTNLVGYLPTQKTLPDFALVENLVQRYPNVAKRINGDDIRFDAIQRFKPIYGNPTQKEEQIGSFATRLAALRDAWNQTRVRYMFHAVLTKFTQKEELKQLLLGTGRAYIYENAPPDSAWGDPDIPDTNAFREYRPYGLNLLGFMLMVVRELLRAEIALKAGLVSGAAAAPVPPPAPPPAFASPPAIDQRILIKLSVSRFGCMPTDIFNNNDISPTWTLLQQYPFAFNTGTPLDTSKPIPFYDKGKICYEFSNFWSQHPFAGWKTAEHYFQAQKYQRDSLLYTQVKNSPTARQAFQLTKDPGALEQERKDWNTTPGTDKEIEDAKVLITKGIPGISDDPELIALAAKDPENAVDLGLYDPLPPTSTTGATADPSGAFPDVAFVEAVLNKHSGGYANEFIREREPDKLPQVLRTQLDTFAKQPLGTLAPLATPPDWDGSIIVGTNSRLELIKREWPFTKVRVMWQALWLKFTDQNNKALHDLLLATQDAYLYEAAHRDDYWGIARTGLWMKVSDALKKSAQDARATISNDSSTNNFLDINLLALERFRPGLNMLGVMLMVLREVLKARLTSPPGAGPAGGAAAPDPNATRRSRLELCAKLIAGYTVDLAKPDPTLYEILGVNDHATPDEIKKAYKKLSIQWHPDKNAGDLLATDVFKLIGEAYSTLSDPDERQKYDHQLKFGAAFAAPGGGPVQPFSWYHIGKFAVPLRPLPGGNLFEDSYGNQCWAAQGGGLPLFPGGPVPPISWWYFLPDQNAYFTYQTASGSQANIVDLLARLNEDCRRYQGFDVYSTMDVKGCPGGFCPEYRTAFKQPFFADNFWWISAYHYFFAQSYKKFSVHYIEYLTGVSFVDEALKFFEPINFTTLSNQRVDWNSLPDPTTSWQYDSLAKIKGEPDNPAINFDGQVIMPSVDEIPHVAPDKKAEIEDKWKQVFTRVLYKVTYYKFKNNPMLLKLLLTSEDFYIQSPGTDLIWSAQGLNLEGILLMVVRKQLRDELRVWLRDKFIKYSNLLGASWLPKAPLSTFSYDSKYNTWNLPINGSQWPNFAWLASDYSVVKSTGPGKVWFFNDDHSCAFTFLNDWKMAIMLPPDSTNFVWNFGYNQYFLAPEKSFHENIIMLDQTPQASPFPTTAPATPPPMTPSPAAAPPPGAPAASPPSPASPAHAAPSSRLEKLKEKVEGMMLFETQESSILFDEDEWQEMAVWKSTLGDQLILQKSKNFENVYRLSPKSGTDPDAYTILYGDPHQQFLARVVQGGLSICDNSGGFSWDKLPFMVPLETMPLSGSIPDLCCWLVDNNLFVDQSKPETSELGTFEESDDSGWRDVSGWRDLGITDFYPTGTTPAVPGKTLKRHTTIAGLFSSSDFSSSASRVGKRMLWFGEPALGYLVRITKDGKTMHLRSPEGFVIKVSDLTTGNVYDALRVVQPTITTPPPLAALQNKLWNTKMALSLLKSRLAALGIMITRLKQRLTLLSGGALSAHAGGFAPAAAPGAGAGGAGAPAAVGGVTPLHVLGNGDPTAFGATQLTNGFYSWKIDDPIKAAQVPFIWGPVGDPDDPTRQVVPQQHVSVASLDDIRIAVVNGNITNITTQFLDTTKSAIVNAANESLAGGGGIDAAIHGAAGSMLRQWNINYVAQCPVGCARISPGFEKLQATKIISVTGPRGTPTNKQQLKDTYQNALRVADNYGITQISFCAISAGLFGGDLIELTPLALNAVVEYLKMYTQGAKKTCIREVRFIAFPGKQTEYQYFRTFFPQQTAVLTEVYNGETQSGSLAATDPLIGCLNNFAQPIAGFSGKPFFIFKIKP